MLILPAAVERQALIDQAVNDRIEIADEFNTELARIDERLRLIFCGENFPALPGVVPGRWHVVRLADRPGDVPSFKAIVGPDGGFMEPHSGIFEQLREMDLWRGDVVDRLKKQRAGEAATRQRRAEAQRAEAREEAALRIKALTNPSIRFGGTGWTARKERL